MTMIYCRKVPRKLLLTKLFVLFLQLSLIFGIEETPTDQQLEQNNLEQTNQQSQEQQSLEATEPNLGQNEQENQDQKEPQSHEQTEPNQGQNEQDNQGQKEPQSHEQTESNQGQNEQDNQDQKDQNLEQNEQNKEQLISEHQKPENPAHQEHQNLEEKEPTPSPLGEKEQQTPKENEHENVVQSAFESQTPIWCYQDPSCGEATWGNLCSSGTAQSPIDLPEMEDPTCLIKNFPLSSYQSQLYTLETDGRTLGIKLLDTLPSFHWDDQEASYSLHSMHMHWSSNDSSGGSEHTINSTQFAAELHMIHYRNDFDSIKEAFASGKKNALAVLGFFFELEPKLKRNEYLQPILKYIPGVYFHNATLAVRDNLDLRPFMRGHEAYTYLGSLTSPPCDEQVAWLIWKRPTKISPSDLQLLRKVKNIVGQPLMDNFRSIQKINERKVELCTIKVSNKRIITR